jgi:hypothetical protein
MSIMRRSCGLATFVTGTVPKLVWKLFWNAGEVLPRVVVIRQIKCLVHGLFDDQDSPVVGQNGDRGVVPTVAGKRKGRGPMMVPFKAIIFPPCYFASDHNILFQWELQQLSG